MTGDERVTRAREFLDGARRRKVAELPPTLLVREDAELRRLLGQVLDVLDAGVLLPITDEPARLLVFALADAVDFRTGKLIACADCDAAELAGEPTGACERHRADFEQGERYGAVGERIGAWAQALGDAR